MTDDPILQTLAPVTHDLGGFKVHRTLPHKERTMVGPFIFFDQMGPARLGAGEGIDVRPHPHINLATVTYLFAGAIDHRDSLGTVQRIEPGAVNLMTAGKGIAHSERTPAEERRGGPHLERHPDLAGAAARQGGAGPGFRACRDRPAAGAAKRRRPPQPDHGGMAGRCLASDPAFADYLCGARACAGAALPIDHEADERALYLLDGDASVDGHALEPQNLVVLAPGARPTLRSSGGARLMLCGGQPMDGERHVWWNFVSSSRDRINAAKRAWRAGEFALPPDDHDEFIPLPEVPLTVSYP